MGAFKLTKLGKSSAGGVSPSSRNPILDYLYEHKVVEEDELANVTGVSKYAVRAELRKFVNRGLVEEAIR